MVFNLRLSICVFQSTSFNLCLSIDIFQSMSFNLHLSIYIFQSMSFNVCLSFYVLQSTPFNPCLSIYVFQSMSFNLHLLIYVFQSVSFNLHLSIYVFQSTSPDCLLRRFWNTVKRGYLGAAYFRGFYVRPLLLTSHLSFDCHGTTENPWTSSAGRISPNLLWARVRTTPGRK